MTKTPRGLRPHIIVCGTVNSGKSTFLNRFTGKDVSITSSSRGTTTDPVYINMELLPFGPVTLVDTPGLDDEGELGQQRIERARRLIASGDQLIFLTRPDAWNRSTVKLINECAKSVHNLQLVFTHRDLPEESAMVNEFMKQFEARQGDAEGLAANITPHHISGTTGAGLEALSRQLIAELEKAKKQERSLLQDMVREYQLVMMVVPIDLEAPKGRLILPQVQAIREVLDADGATLTVKEREIDWALSLLRQKPDLAVTDSQAVLKAAGSIPEDIPLTTFSILFSRLKGDLKTFVDASDVIDDLQDGDRILIAETCTHKTMCDDIGRVKIPRWLRQYSGKDLDIRTLGGEFPTDLDNYRLIIHCGGCMITRKRMLQRMGLAAHSRVPITNYGIAISKLHHVLERVLRPFTMSGDGA
ncbi:[FeFe] hydrogenase H-cluster maturation GTPase HydF [Salinispira pacifica]|uniref:[FeFe]-hydrogenase maturation protein HydF n=1 Tax=Salinispira pacifica TaxID=1307761 RepID=V5WHP9_9SPIO|nr:[FeFe] hydrogenase H-cluster maturation GTPase HydF [Salinispira pacifica]AHC15338.1 [FeFe]-hydrogenase maturation protein HydF [Salinispira pacifica]